MGAGQLINKYNRHPKISTSGLTIDETLTDIRNAIGHGRVSAKLPSSDLRLLNFSYSKDKKVKVKFSALLTKDWFNTQISRFHDAILKVKDVNERTPGGR